ncbi:MAG: 30S ribosomal protein S2 [Caldilineaceae bacterium]|nr:30S ribosomal protein S2 [Caldilineaceae bacterium]MCB0142437.1 30S ribosomal protein S2 [Caldilineaceae bacterium]
MSVITMKQLLEAGVHFGHRTRRWNPKMRPYIFTERSGIHIIDLQQTMLRIEEYYNMVRDLVVDGGTILFVGTKRQAQATVKAEADRCGMPYINQRWLGGTLTNWVTIRQRIEHLLRLERRWDAGEFRGLTKMEQLSITREIEKLNRRIGGLKIMKQPPDLIFIVDSHTEDLAVKEANKLGIPMLAMVDTNSNPDPIDYIIPSNDDAIRSVKLIVSVIANAVEEGVRMREIDLVETGKVSDADLAEMEQYLGPSTLAKLQVVGTVSDEEENIPDIDEDAVEENADSESDDDFDDDYDEEDEDEKYARMAGRFGDDDDDDDE